VTDDAANEHGPDPVDPENQRLTRRTLLHGAIGLAASTPLIGGLAACGGSSKQTKPSKVKRGGTLRVGVVGSGTAENLNPSLPDGEISPARQASLFQGLVGYTPQGRTYNLLAEEISPNQDATVWKVKLRQGVLFHDGSPLTADDVVYTFRYILDPKNKAEGAAALAGLLTPSGVRRLDQGTVELRLGRPFAVLPEVLAERTLLIFKNGMKAADFDTKPIGTGPFKFKSFARGERSVFVRNDQYWEHGLPYLDSVEIVSFSDAAALVRALTAGQIDALAQLDTTSIPTLKSNPAVQVLSAPGAPYTLQYMRTDRAPFNDNRVRQAFRYLVDREQMISNALSGQGKIGNDLYCWFDPDYASDIPQREHDPERAQSLLKSAGHDNLTVTLYTADAAPGMLASSTLLAEQAKKAGVTVNLKNTPASQYYSGPYLKVPFACSNWGGWPLVVQLGLSTLSTSADNETEWKRPGFDKLVTQAYSTLDDAKRKDMLHTAQLQLWNQGGNIIWGFLNNVDAISSKVHGIRPSVLRNLGFYDFRSTYLS
jgi:peptide/nickel transport system substrate-binding protein